jgi:serine/threonine protein phosphatase PrpC
MEMEGSLVVVVADGAGGLANAGRAAEFVVDSVMSRVAGRVEAMDWGSMLSDIDRSLATSGMGGESTAVVAAVTANAIAGASVGDSGAWLIRPSGYEDLTRRTVRKPLLGSGHAIPTSLRADAAAGTLLVATDGLLKYGRPSELCLAALTPDLTEAADLLVQSVRLRSGALADDVGFVLLRC